MLAWTPEQENRLRELGASGEDLKPAFENPGQRNQAFQKLEKKLAQQAAQVLRDYGAKAGRPALALLENRLAEALTAEGFMQVVTPIIMSRAHLAKMGVDDQNPLMKQIFWLDQRSCLRPMLAPHLYYLLVDLLRILPHPVSLFEIGPCFRKETQGARHAGEFTMLNLVEMGLPLEERRSRLEHLAKVVIRAAGLKEDDCRLTVQDSGVYGETLDVEGPDGLELASTAQGPHPLDGPWGIDVPWVGLGFGLERLIMTLRGETSLGRNGRSLSYVDGIRLNV